MKKLASLLVILLAALALRATDVPAGELVQPSEKDAAWLAGARDAYPLKTCLVSGEELGGMGKPADYIYRQAGQPDRLVRFCCRMCVPRFKKDPAHYLARLSPEEKPADSRISPPPAQRP